MPNNFPFVGQIPAGLKKYDYFHGLKLILK